MEMRLQIGMSALYILSVGKCIYYVLCNCAYKISATLYL